MIIIVIVMMIQEIFQCVDGDGDVNATMIMMCMRVMVNGYEDHEYDDDMVAMMMMKQMTMMMMTKQMMMMTMMHVLHMMTVCQSDFKCEMN